MSGDFSLQVQPTKIFVFFVREDAVTGAGNYQRNPFDWRYITINNIKTSSRETLLTPRIGGCGATTKEAIPIHLQLLEFIITESRHC